MAQNTQTESTQDFTAGPIRLNLNMVYDPATALSRGEPLFLGSMIAPEAETEPVLRDRGAELLAKLDRIEYCIAHLVNLADAVECIMWEVTQDSTQHGKLAN